MCERNVMKYFLDIFLILKLIQKALCDKTAKSKEAKLPNWFSWSYQHLAAERYQAPLDAVRRRGTVGKQQVEKWSYRRQ